MKFFPVITVVTLSLVLFLAWYLPFKDLRNPSRYRDPLRTRENEIAFYWTASHFWAHSDYSGPSKRLYRSYTVIEVEVNTERGICKEPLKVSEGEYVKSFYTRARLKTWFSIPTSAYYNL
jgi:hypothetical protein